MRKSSRVTIKDIARTLHLSTATISRALSNKGEHNDQTVELVKQTARSMGYVRNTSAADLVQRESHVIAVVVSNTHSNFGISIIEAIERRADEHGLDVFIVLVGNNDEEAQKRAIRTAVERAVRGIVLISLELGDSVIKVLKDSGIPCVSLSACVKNDVFPVITSDNFRMGYRATEFLIRRGHKAIGLAGVPGSGTVAARIDGYRQCLSDYRLPCDDRWIYRGTCVYEDGVAAVNAYAEAGSAQFETANFLPMTAIIGASDLAALGVMNRAGELGVHVPDDLSVMSFDGTEIVNMVHPTITSVTQDFRGMGTEGFDLLLADGSKGPDDVTAPVGSDADGNEGKAEKHYIPFRIIERGSTKEYNPARKRER